MGGVGVFHCGFSLHPFNHDNIDFFFHTPIGICISSSVKCLFMSFAQFFVFFFPLGLVIILLLMDKSSSDILGISPCKIYV